MIRLGRLIKSFTYAFRGLIKTFKEEQNLKIQTLAAILVVALAFYFKVSRSEWALLIMATSLVILMEMVNSSVERAADVLKPRINGYVKEIKDVMAAAVLLSAIAAIVVGLIIFLPHFLG